MTGPIPGTIASSMQTDGENNDDFFLLSGEFDDGELELIGSFDEGDDYIYGEF